MIPKKTQPKKRLDFDSTVETGQAIMLDIPTPSKGVRIGAHPYLILSVDDYAVEMVLCTTANDPSKGKYRGDMQYRSLMLGRGADSLRNYFEIPSDRQHPPFDSDRNHTTAVELDEHIVLPIGEVLGQRGWFMEDGRALDKSVLTQVTKAARQIPIYDPSGYLDDPDPTDEKWGVDAYKKEWLKEREQMAKREEEREKARLAAKRQEFQAKQKNDGSMSLA